MSYLRKKYIFTLQLKYNIIDINKMCQFTKFDWNISCIAAMHSFISYPYNITSIETDLQISDIAYVPVYTRNALIVATIQFIFEVSKAFPDHLHACFLPHFRFCPL